MEYQKTAEATGDVTSNNIANKITKVSRSSPQNTSEAITNELDKKIPKERHLLQKKDIKLLVI